MKKYKLFCDLDGVLVDFENGVNELTGKLPEHQTIENMWKKISYCENFFENLKFTNYGKQMWTHIVDIYENVPTILTGVPSNNKKNYDIQKINWCKNNLGKNIDVITCNSFDKYKYAATNHILIDDRIKIGRQWISAGGLFIHHVTPERTLYELKIIFGKQTLILNQI